MILLAISWTLPRKSEHSNPRSSLRINHIRHGHCLVFENAFGRSPVSSSALYVHPIKVAGPEKRLVFPCVRAMARLNDQMSARQQLRLSARNPSQDSMQDHRRGSNMIYHCSSPVIVIILLVIYTKTNSQYMRKLARQSHVDRTYRYR